MSGTRLLYQRGNTVPVQADAMIPVGAHGNNTSLAAVATLTAPTGATELLVQALVQNVRYTLDAATAPTATVGFQLKAGDSPISIPVAPGASIRFVQEAAGAVLQFQWSR